MKLPNGYGSIYKMKGNRRKPYAVVKTTYENGKRKSKYLGYFETKPLAIKFLSEYNLLPQERQNLMTFADLYNEWSGYHYPKLVEGSVKTYTKAYERCSALYESKLVDISQSALQSVIDNSMGIVAKRNIYYLLKSMYDYAERRDYIERNRVSYLEKPKQEKSTKHRRLTDSELQTLWANKDNEYVATFLVLICTGCRPMELFNGQIEKDRLIISKGKTENATRVVPFHNDILDLIPKISFVTCYATWSRYFQAEMKELGIECTPYDARHTFTSLWSEQGLNEYMRCKIQGHSTKSLGQDIYAHYSFEVLQAEMNKLHTGYIQNPSK